MPCLRWKCFSRSHGSRGSIDGSIVTVNQAIRAAKAQVAAAGDGAAEGEAFLSVWGGPAHLAALSVGREG